MNPNVTIFKTERSKYAKPIFLIWIALMLAFNIWGIFGNPQDSYADNLMAGIGSLVLIGVVSYFYKNNYYKLTDNKLEIVSGFREWNIKIEDIYLIKLDQNQAAINGYFGKDVRAGQGLRGIIIYYEKDHSIFISPAQQDNFIEIISKVNSNIEIRQGLSRKL